MVDDDDMISVVIMSLCLPLEASNSGLSTQATGLGRRYSKSCSGTVTTWRVGAESTATAAGGRRLAGGILRSGLDELESAGWAGWLDEAGRLSAEFIVDGRPEVQAAWERASKPTNEASWESPSWRSGALRLRRRTGCRRVCRRTTRRHPFEWHVVEPGPQLSEISESLSQVVEGIGVDSRVRIKIPRVKVLGGPET